MYIKIALYTSSLSNSFLYLVYTLESHFRYLSLAGEKSRIDEYKESLGVALIYIHTRYIVYKIVEVTQDISNDLGHQLLRLKKKVSTIHHSK